MQEQERKTKLLKGMLPTFATLTYFNEFLQKSTKLMSSSFKFQLLLFVFPKLYNSLSMVTWFVFLDIILPRTLLFYLTWRNGEEMKKMEEKWSPSYFLLLQRTWAVFKGGEGDFVLYKITKMLLLMPLVSSSSIYPIWSTLIKPFPNPIDMKF
jgi:hypothetical protein